MTAARSFLLIGATPGVMGRGFESAVLACLIASFDWSAAQRDRRDA